MALAGERLIPIQRHGQQLELDMQSRRDETAKQARKHAEIQAQINHLKNQLPPGERDVDPESKRNQPRGLLVPATPSPSTFLDAFLI